MSLLPKHLPILMYHQVLPKSHPDFAKHIAIDPEDFRNHIQTLKNRGWKFKTVDQYFSQAPEDKVAILTFDDCASSFYEFALPIIEEFGVKVSVFPIQNMTTHKEYHNLSHDGVRGLTEDELKHIANLGHELGSHAQSHRNLHTIPFEEVTTELTESKAWLESITGKPVNTVCYPIGGIDRDIVELATKLGFKNGLSIFKCSLQILPADRMKLRRVDIKHHTVGDKFLSSIGPFYGLRRFLTRPFRSKYRVDMRHPSFQ